ncbi:MAG: anthranilate phosphoribosyltransferase [Verrucomicrobiae bacterium]|nr:anthranilate phosphoribosyltransferase [Verrucomicrobiae bacterium]
MTPLISALREGKELDAAAIEEAANALLDDSVADDVKADLLRALADKGETPAEIAGFVKEFLKRAVDPAIDRASLGRPMIDVCGTGGDKLDLFNVSTTSVFVLAACGVAVVKHGNRGITSKSGGADVLEALGIRIDLPPETFGDCLAEVGAGFLFAPMYHPAFKAIVPVRKQLAEEGRRSIFNLLGPLLNPARPDFQLIGVFDENLTPAFAEILGRLGRTRAWAVHGHTETGEGMDELSSVGPTSVHETIGIEHPVAAFTIQPAELGLAPAEVSDLRGGDANENAALLRAILDGSEAGPKRDIVLLNAAAGLTICGLASDLGEGLERAREAIDSGAATKVLERWRQFSERA